MSASSLARKLLIKPGNRVVVLNPPDGYAALLGDLPEDATLNDAGAGPGDVVQLFVTTRAEMAEQAPDAADRLVPGGVLWICYPKGGKSELSREALQLALRDRGWRPVTQVAIDETWSAMRFRPESDVKSRRS